MYRRRHVGFVFQFYNLIPSLTARENVALVTDIVERPMPPEEALALVDLSDRLDHFPSQLSGGEQQRVAIARAVAKRPDVLLCDEPTGALDISTGILVLQAIGQVNRELGTTTAVITHNAAVAMSIESWRCRTDASHRSAASSQAAALGARMAYGRSIGSHRTCGRQGQALAISLVIGAGVAMFIMCISTFHSLRLTQQTADDRCTACARVCRADRAPLNLRDRVAEIPGVARVDARVVVDVTLDVPGLTEPPAAV